MNDRLRTIREKCLKRDFKQYRQDIVLNFAEEFKENGYSIAKRSSERIAITRTLKAVPSIYTDDEWTALNVRRADTSRELSKSHCTCLGVERLFR